MRTGPVEGPGYHVPVLLEPVLQFWIGPPDGRYVDATLGDGGHTRAALARLSPAARILGIDRDPEAIERSRARLGDEPRVTLRQARYDELDRLLDELNWDWLDGVLADLGVSSRQLDAPERGFSFRFEGPLDLRMDPTRGESAAGFLARATEEEIADVFWQYAEAPRSRAAARAVVRQRERRPLETTQELVRALAPVAHGPRRRAELARYFQALRIQVNGEMESLDRFLEVAPRRLRPGGRLVVLAYHSLEDRRIKHLFQAPDWQRLTKKPVQGRTDPNPRARSARLRAAMRR